MIKIENNSLKRKSIESALISRASTGNVCLVSLQTFDYKNVGCLITKVITHKQKETK